MKLMFLTNLFGLGRMICLFVFLGFFIFSCNSSSSDQAESELGLKLPSGFHVEHLYSPKEHDQGSWVAMTFDDQGRMITSDQYGNLYRSTLPPIGYDTLADSPIVEKLPINLPNDTFPAKYKIGYAHGLLYAFNSLYVVVNDEGDADTLTRRSGLYRLEDTDGDDVYDKLTLLKSLEGRGEHGPHNLVVSPDGETLFLIAGNFTEIPQGVDGYYLPNTWKEDNLLPRLADPRGFGVNLHPPGGWIAELNPDGSDWKLFSAGFRNPFNLAFNEDGELFTYDSDMEWDLGLPWYRPTRICHVIQGGEFGYRENNLKWSPSYLDNLPAILEIGQGSPTAMFSGVNARFPEHYRKGLFTFDWSFGIIYHVNLTADGASYKAESEEFVSGTSLPLTSGAIGPDGALYFQTGGRRLESNLYRVYYKKGDEKVKSLKERTLSPEEKARETRRMLEELQVQSTPEAVETIWPYLKDSDRFIRYAARIALEHQPSAEWKEKALGEDDPIIQIQSLLALVRSDQEADEEAVLHRLSAIDYDDLEDGQKLDLMRTIEVALYRLGIPEEELKEKLIAYLSPTFLKTDDEDLNRVSGKVLAYLGDPDFVKKAVPLLYEKVNQNKNTTATQSSDLIMRNMQYGSDIAEMLANMPPERQTYYSVVLSGAKAGWTDELRDQYFKWFYNSFDKYKGGRSYVGFVNEARQLALKNIPEQLYAHYNTLSGDSLLTESGNDLANIPTAKGPGRQWELDSAIALVNRGMKDLDFDDGKKMFLAARCGACHRVGSVGGGDVGPDLTQVGTRFSYDDILESIIDPNKEISSQYAATVFYLKDNKTVVGRLIKEEDGKYFVSQNPFAPQDLRELPKKEVSRTELSKTSIMPPGMINSLNPDELKDLLAYLKSGGDKENELYK